MNYPPFVNDDNKVEYLEGEVANLQNLVKVMQHGQARLEGLHLYWEKKAMELQTELDDMKKAPG